MTILPRQIARAKFFARAALAASVSLLPACHGSADAHPLRADASTAARAPGAPKSSPSSMPHGTVRFDTPRGSWVIDAEIAKTPEEHQRGLMYRRELPQDHGMLFVFDEAREQRFWMHNTLLRLDMIFLGEDRSVLGIVENAEPQTDTGRGIGNKPARYVLEVLGGESAAHAVGPGARAQFIGVDE